MNPKLTSLVGLALFGLLQAPAQAAARGDSGVTRATLKNGMRVVIVPNKLAAVATVEMNFVVGAVDTPAGFPGMAHAEEHMAFRGCTGMSADQTAAIYAQLGGDNNADTQQNITQYYATVPSADVDVALEAQAACLKGADNTKAEWDQERGAIDQEVARDLSNPQFKFLDRMVAHLFPGTPYDRLPLGTKASFDATTNVMLQDFYKQWYTPANGILVIVGNVDPQATLSRVRQLFEAIPSHPLPEHAPVTLQPVTSDSFTLDSNLPYVLGFVAYRLPGTDSPDYAPAQILVDVLASQRGDLYALVPAGRALAAQFGLAESYPKASAGYGFVALPAGTDPAGAMREMQSVISRYAAKGLPAELVEAAKKSELAQAEFQRNSIPGLANVWSNALAAEGRKSPDEDVDAIRKVTVDDVNRVAKEYLLNVNTITAILKSVPTGQPVAAAGFGGGEKLTSAPTQPVVLPDWAATRLEQLKIPQSSLTPTDVTLANGIRLIVVTDHTSATVSLLGSVRHNDDLQTPIGQEGVADLLDGMYSYGTTSLDRLAFQKALDDIAANESAGYRFSLSVLKENFSHGVQLLADNELHPALPADGFQVVQKQTSDFVAGNLQSPGYRTARALQLALLPSNDPTLREATPATLNKVSLDQVKSYYATTVRPDVTTIVVIGDVSAAEARAVVEKWFGGWKAVGPKPPLDLEKVPANKPSAQNVADAEQIQDSVTLAQQLTIDRFSPDYYPLQLGTHVLGGGFYATRLYHDLRQVSGYVYNVDVGLSAAKTRSTYTVTYGCDPQNVSKARQLAVRDLEQMRTEPVSAAELHQAKALLLRQLPLSESSEDAVAAVILARAEMGLPLDESERAARKYIELDAEAVKAAFARNIRTDNLVQVVRGPAPQ